MRQALQAAAAAAAVLVGGVNAASADPVAHVRFLNVRIGEVFELMLDRSASFTALVAELDRSDVVAYLEEGRCVPGARSCLHIMGARAGVRYVRINLDPRQLLPKVVAQIAHELQHAVEIARRPQVIDAGSLRALYREIGYASCSSTFECWETARALDVEAAVVHEVSSRQVVVSR